MGTDHYAQSKQLRKGRWSAPGQIYLLTSATWRRRPVFADQALGQVLVEAMNYPGFRGQTESLVFVVRPDHFHWLLALGKGMTMAKIMASLKSDSSHRIKSMAGDRFAVGPLWQEGYHDHALRQEDVRQVAQYVAANPWRADLVQKLAEYPLWGGIYQEEFAGLCLQAAHFRELE